MAKFYGTLVKTGKVGGEVYAIRNGETIVRQYQPMVLNPKSAAQEEARAKLKLLSQVSAVVAPAIAFAREGMVTPRNRFVSKNYPNVTYGSDKAEVNMSSLDLTGGYITLPQVAVVSRDGSQITVGLSTSPMTTIDEVVYAIVETAADGTMLMTHLLRVTTPGVNNHFEVTAGMAATHVGYVYAYGIKYADATARDRYTKLSYTSPKAFIEVIRQVASSEVYLTITSVAAITAA